MSYVFLDLYILPLYRAAHYCTTTIVNQCIGLYIAEIMHQTADYFTFVISPAHYYTTFVKYCTCLYKVEIMHRNSLLVYLCIVQLSTAQQL